MEIIYLCQDSSDNTILYSPEIALPESPASVGQGYPAVGCDRRNPQETYSYFYLSGSRLHEYQEYRDYYWQEFLYEILGGREKLEQKLLSMAAMTEIYTVMEAAELWGLNEPGIREACRQGRFSATEARNSGGIWLVSGEGMKRLYGTSIRA